MSAASLRRQSQATVSASPDMLNAAHQFMSDKNNTDLKTTSPSTMRNSPDNLDAVPPHPPLSLFTRSARAVVESTGGVTVTVPPLEFSSLRQTPAAANSSAAASLHKFPSPLPASRRESHAGESSLNVVSGVSDGGDQSGDAAFAAAVAAAAAAAAATSNEIYRNRFSRSPAMGGSTNPNTATSRTASSSEEVTPGKNNKNNNASPLVVDTTNAAAAAAAAALSSNASSSSSSSSASSSLMTFRSHSPISASASGGTPAAAADNKEKVKRLESEIVQFLDLAAKSSGVRRAPRRERGNLTDLLSDATTAMKFLASS